eukprot:TRINITY_DN24568_c0_g1_i7.p1 TRINITY_DN24568_c0_g1~~TRINITY_DN24568_c0_g1_i7.p1  ORF type:complete len:634 (+),score=130.38 TRINITY_DN24568_c0_g1_i7:147-1904(+)
MVRVLRLLVCAACVSKVVAQTTCTDEQHAESSYNLQDKLWNNYDKSIAPLPTPVNVAVSATLTKVSELNTQTSTFKINMYFRHEWTDSRLRWDPAAYCGIDFRYSVPKSFMWLPDTFFSNAQDVDSVDSEEFVQVNASGRCFWSRRVVVKIFCSMNFANYPFDEQSCFSDIESYGLPVEVLVYNLSAPGMRWSEPIDGADGGTTVGTYRMSSPTAEQRVLQIGSHTFSSVRYSFMFTRISTRYAASLFFPLALVTLLSYLGLFIDPKVAPARVGMAITTVLVLISLMFVLTKEIPSNIDYLSGMDALFALCLLFVSANSIEYAIVNYLNTAIAQNEEKISKRKKLRQGKSGKRVLDRSGKMATLSAELEDIFRLFDQDNTGSIDTDDVAAIFRSIAADHQATISPEKVSRMVREVDSDGSGTIELEEFTKTLCENQLMCMELGLTEPNAILVCGKAVSRRRVLDWESRYRTLVLPLFALAVTWWFLWNATEGADGAAAVAAFVTVAAASAAVFGVLVWRVCFRRPAPPPPPPQPQPYAPPPTLDSSPVHKYIELSERSGTAGVGNSPIHSRMSSMAQPRQAEVAT